MLFNAIYLAVGLAVGILCVLIAILWPVRTRACNSCHARTKVPDLRSGLCPICRRF